MDLQHLQDTPLRAVAMDRLEMFAWKAMTTWGTAADYKHFLPRLCELILTEGWPVCIETVLGGKLAMAQFREWPDAQKSAVLTWFDVLWGTSLLNWPPREWPASVLCCIARATQDVRSPLGPWRVLCTGESVARVHLAHFVCCSDLGNPSPPVFWEECPACWTQVLDWLRSSEAACAVEGAFVDWLEHEDGRGYEYKLDQYRAFVRATA